MQIYGKMLHDDEIGFEGEQDVTDSYKYSYKVKDKLMNSLSVYNVGYQKCTPGHQWVGIRDHYLLHHIIRGKGYYETGGRKYTLKSGDTFLVYPHILVKYWADEEEPWEYTWVGFNGSDVFSLLEHTDFLDGNPVIEQASMSKQIMNQMLEVYEAKGNTFSDAVAMTGALYSLMSMFIKHSQNEGNTNDQQSRYLKSAIQYISERYSYGITVEDIADYIGVSRSYMFRIFQKLLKMSPKEYLSEYRLQKASQLLKESELPISAVAKSVGFEDNLYFSKVFKKYKGKTPSEYKKENS